MIASLVQWTVRQRRISLIIWSIAITCFIAMNLAFYPSFKNQTAQLEQSLSQIPEAAIALFSDTGDFFSPEGYLSSQVFYFMLPLLLGILAIGLGASLIAKEEREGTIELLLSRPVPRSTLLLSKALAGLTILGIVALCGTITTLIISYLVNIEVPLLYIAEASLVCFMLAVAFGSVAFAVSLIGKFGRGLAIGIASAYAILGYVIGSLIGFADWLKYPAKLFPFYYYHPADLLRGQYNWADLWFIVMIIVVSAVTSYYAFRRRDLR